MSLEHATNDTDDIHLKMNEAGYDSKGDIDAQMALDGLIGKFRIKGKPSLRLVESVKAEDSQPIAVSVPGNIAASSL